MTTPTGRLFLVLHLFENLVTYSKSGFFDSPDPRSKKKKLRMICGEIAARDAAGGWITLACGVFVFEQWYYT